MNTPSFNELGRFLDTNRQTLLTVLTVLELLILLVVLLRWFDRRYGLRGTGRRIRRGVVGAARELAAPIVGFVRLRRGMRVVAGSFAGSGPVPAARAWIASARSALAERDDFWPYLVLSGHGELSVRLAGADADADVPSPAPGSPWQVTAPRQWRARGQLPPGSAPTASDALPIAVGVKDRTMVLLDFARSPGIVSVHGAPAPAQRLVSALGLQLAALTGGHGVHRLIVAAETGDGSGAFGVDRMSLSAAVTDLATRTAPSGRTVLVCRRPDPQTAARLASLVAGDPGLLVLVAGYLPGSRWRLRVDLVGRVTAPELLLDVDSVPLVRCLLPRRRAAPAAPPAPAWAEEEFPRPAALAAASSAPAEPAMPERPRPSVPAGATPPAAHPPPGPSVPPTANDDLIEQAHDGQRPTAYSGVESGGRAADPASRAAGPVSRTGDR
ncbi:hypothetical protein O7608_02615 [Solwaraspora sp. WMMA2056]|uniref:hypothetical protein n=1 Tax=Solwaraspora sp. WMMA2056 TaxID=3015161 RepID=UPI00259BC6E5|nr:hypothetical protein [Solwaraspora sp. WMMA2056]WJK41347.1 hypothetical protein O7608_02615 [Solwaraspora sp. WMMA2056]